MPTIRIATPLPGSDGKPFGILIINVDMRPALDRVRSSPRLGREVYVVNATGRLSRSPRSCARIRLGAWGADQLARRLPGPGIGSRGNAKHSHVSWRIEPDSRAEWCSRPPFWPTSEWVGVIETVPNAAFMAAAAAIRHTTMLVGLIAVLSAAALAVFIARSLTGPIRRLTAAVEGAGSGNPIAVPVDARSETGVLARAFARVMSEANAKTAELEREVMEHRRTEAARDHYAARERIFSAAVESSNDSIVTYSLDGIISGWNPAAERLYGYSAAEAVGKNIDLLVPPDRSDETHDILRRTGRGEPVEPFETVRSAQGRQRGRSLAQRIADQEPRRGRSSGHPRRPATSPKAGEPSRHSASRSRSAAASSRPPRI